MLPETAVKERNINKVYVYAVVDTKKCSYLQNWNIMKVIYKCISKIFLWVVQNVYILFL